MKLKWTVELEHESWNEKEESQVDGEVSVHNQVDHLVSEIGNLFCNCPQVNLFWWNEWTNIFFKIMYKKNA
jgi:hypothetical protein